MEKLLRQLFEDYKKKENITYEIFIERINEALREDGVDCMRMMSKKYADKRRGKEVKETFDEIEAQFKKIIRPMVESKDDYLETLLNKPFMQELFDKFVDYRYSVKEGDQVHESTNLADLRTKVKDHAGYELTFSMKEDEKHFVDFCYFKRWWKPRFSEGKNIEEFIISLSNKSNINLNSNLIEAKEDCSMHYMTCKEFFSRDHQEAEYLKAGSREFVESVNPVWIKRIDAGKVCLIESENKIIFQFQGKELIGNYEAVRPEKNCDFWKISKIS